MSASPSIIIGKLEGVNIAVITPIHKSEPPESTRPMIPTVFIPIFAAILLAVSWRTIPGTPIIARRI